MEKKASEIPGKLKQKGTASTPRNREKSRGESSMDSRDANASVPRNLEFDVLVARKAFELYQRRGGETGRDVEDWLEAERLIEQETQSSKR